MEEQMIRANVLIYHIEVTIPSIDDWDSPRLIDLAYTQQNTRFAENIIEKKSITQVPTRRMVGFVAQWINQATPQHDCQHSR